MGINPSRVASYPIPLSRGQVHREGSKQCIVLGYGKSKLRDCDKIDSCVAEKILKPGKENPNEFIRPHALQNLLSRYALVKACTPGFEVLAGQPE